MLHKSWSSCFFSMHFIRSFAAKSLSTSCLRATSSAFIFSAAIISGSFLHPSLSWNLERLDFSWKKVIVGLFMVSVTMTFLNKQLSSDFQIYVFLSVLHRTIIKRIDTYGCFAKIPLFTHLRNTAPHLHNFFPGHKKSLSCILLKIMHFGYIQFIKPISVQLLLL